MQQLNDIHSTPIQSAALLFSLEHPIQNVALILAVITSHRKNDKDAVTLLRLKRGRGLVADGARGMRYLARARYAACVRTYPVLFHLAPVVFHLATVVFHLVSVLFHFSLAISIERFSLYIKKKVLL